MICHTQHNGGIESIKLYTQGPEGYTDEIWTLNDFSMESNEEWWIGQVDFNDYKVWNSKETLIR